MLSPKTTRNITRIIPFGVLWLFFSLLYTVLEKGLLGNLGHYPLTGVPYDFARNVFTIPAASLMMGILSGILEITYFSKRFIKKSFTAKIIFKSILYLIILIIFLFILSFINVEISLKLTTPFRFKLTTYSAGN